MQAKYDYFSLRPVFSTNTPISLYLRGQQDEFYIGVNMQLCGPENQAYIASLPLAERAKEAALPRLRNRFGLDTDILISRRSTQDHAIGKRIEQHTAMLDSHLSECGPKANDQP